MILYNYFRSHGRMSRDSICIIKFFFSICHYTQITTKSSIEYGKMGYIGVHAFMMDASKRSNADA